MKIVYIQKFKYKYNTEIFYMLQTLSNSGSLKKLNHYCEAT